MYINSIELGYYHYWEKSSIMSSIFFSYITDIISRTTSIEGKANIVKPENINTGYRLGGELIYSNRMISWWNLNLSLTSFLLGMDGQSENKSLNMNSIIFVPKINSMFNYKGYSLQLSGFLRSGFRYSQGYLHPMYRIDLGINKKFLDNKLTLGFRVRDLLNQYAFSIDVDRENFWSKRNIQWSSREFYISVRYSFGNLKTKKKRTEDRMPPPNNDGGAEMAY